MLSNWKYASIIVAVGSATASALLQWSNTYTWVPIALTGISTITALFAPQPTLKKAQEPPTSQGSNVNVIP